MVRSGQGAIRQPANSRRERLDLAHILIVDFASEVQYFFRSAGVRRFDEAYAVVSRPMYLTLFADGLTKHLSLSCGAFVIADGS